MITPTNTTFEKTYEAPSQLSHSLSAGDQSWLTNFLLRHTSKYPLLHTIMTDKNSRRISYYLWYAHGKTLWTLTDVY